MATGLQAWSKTAATNASSDSTVNWAEGMAPSAVNDSSRAEMASAAKWRDDISGTVTTGGSSTAYTMTTNQGFATAAAMSGAMLCFIPHATNGASPTLAVDGLTARAINKSTGVAVATGQLIIGTPYVVSYIHATTEFILQGYTETFGNVTVNGTTLLTGVATFTGAPVFNGGGSLNTGTFSGAATFSGNLVLSGLPNYTNVTKAFGIAGGTTGQRNGSPTAGDTRYNTSFSGLEYWNGTAWIVLGQQPTIQAFASGSGTYTAAAGVVRQRVRLVGGGGGGGARTTNAGTNGTSSTFKVNNTGTAWVATLGAGGAIAGAGGVGGASGTDGSTGTRIIRCFGADGGACSMQVDATGDSQSSFTGGAGGSSVLGGAGMPAATTGGAAKTNSGSGGAGGNSSVGTKGGGGGGAGEYVEFWVTGMATAPYVVGAKGTGGAAGGSAGADGADGVIIVEEFYS